MGEFWNNNMVHPSKKVLLAIHILQLSRKNSTIIKRIKSSEKM